MKPRRGERVFHRSAADSLATSTPRPPAEATFFRRSAAETSKPRLRDRFAIHDRRIFPGDVLNLVSFADQYKNQIVEREVLLDDPAGVLNGDRVDLGEIGIDIRFIQPIKLQTRNR